MTVTIIISTRNRSAYLLETLRSLAAVSVPSEMTCELLILDNASTDDTAALASAFPLENMSLQVISVLRPGKSYALNQGLEASAGDILLFTDDDLRLPTNWLEAMCQPIQSGEADGVAGAVTLAPHLQRPWMEPIHRYWLAETMTAQEAMQSYGEPLTMVGANMAIARQVLKKIPEFDTSLGPGALGFADDTLFSKQMLAAGCQIVYAENAKVEHHFQPDRLLRASLLAAAKQRGETRAYVAHHWEHRRIYLPAARMLHKKLQVALWYRRNPELARETEGLPSGLMYNLEAYHFYRYFLLESRKPRLYENHGLRKRSFA